MWLSIMGMYEYDNTIFDGLELPSYTDPDNVVHTIDREKLINSILLSCAELEVIYPDFNVMKLAIGVWSAAEYDSWKKLYTSQMVSYNPIWNVDANISQARNREGTNLNVGSVQGFNENRWANANKDDGSFTDDETFTERRTGNIGVTATQDLLKKEREIAEFSIIDYITLSFKKRFCLLVY